MLSVRYRIGYVDWHIGTPWVPNGRDPGDVLFLEADGNELDHLMARWPQFFPAPAHCPRVVAVWGDAARTMVANLGR